MRISDPLRDEVVRLPKHEREEVRQLLRNLDADPFAGHPISIPMGGGTGEFIYGSEHFAVEYIFSLNEETGEVEPWALAIRRTPTSADLLAALRKQGLA